MSQFKATLSDGRIVTLEAETKPDEWQVLSALAEYEDAPSETPTSLTPGLGSAAFPQAAPFEPTSERRIEGGPIRDLLDSGVGIPEGQYPSDAPAWQTPVEPPLPVSGMPAPTELPENLLDTSVGPAAAMKPMPTGRELYTAGTGNAPTDAEWDKLGLVPGGRNISTRDLLELGASGAKLVQGVYGWATSLRGVTEIGLSMTPAKPAILLKWTVDMIKGGFAEVGELWDAFQRDDSQAIKDHAVAGFAMLFGGVQAGKHVLPSAFRELPPTTRAQVIKGLQEKPSQVGAETSNWQAVKNYVAGKMQEAHQGQLMADLAPQTRQRMMTEAAGREAAAETASPARVAQLNTAAELERLKGKTGEEATANERLMAQLEETLAKQRAEAAIPQNRAEQAAVELGKVLGLEVVPVERFSGETTTNPKPFDVFNAVGEGRVELRRADFAKKWNEDWDGLTDEQKMPLLRATMVEEWVHNVALGLFPPDVLEKFSDNLTSVEAERSDRFVNKTAEGHRIKGPQSAQRRAHEYMRIRAQRLMGMSVTEIVEAVGKEKWKLEGIDLMLRGIYRARRMAGTRASAEQAEMMDRLERKLGVARQAAIKVQAEEKKEGEKDAIQEREAEALPVVARPGVGEEVGKERQGEAEQAQPQAEVAPTPTPPDLPLPDWAREAMVRAGLDPARPFNDVDLQNPSVRDAIQSDPTLTSEQKTSLLDTGSLEKAKASRPSERYGPEIAEARKRFGDDPGLWTTEQIQSLQLPGTITPETAAAIQTRAMRQAYSWGEGESFEVVAAKEVARAKLLIQEIDQLKAERPSITTRKEAWLEGAPELEGQYKWDAELERKIGLKEYELARLRDRFTPAENASLAPGEGDAPASQRNVKDIENYTRERDGLLKEAARFRDMGHDDWARQLTGLAAEVDAKLKALGEQSFPASQRDLPVDRESDLENRISLMRNYALKSAQDKNKKVEFADDVARASKYQLEVPLEESPFPLDAPASQRNVRRPDPNTPMFGGMFRLGVEEKTPAKEERALPENTFQTPTIANVREKVDSYLAGTLRPNFTEMMDDLKTQIGPSVKPEQMREVFADALLQRLVKMPGEELKRTLNQMRLGREINLKKPMVDELVDAPADPTALDLFGRVIPSGKLKQAVRRAKRARAAEQEYRGLLRQSLQLQEQLKERGYSGVNSKGEIITDRGALAEPLLGDVEIAARIDALRDRMDELLDPNAEARRERTEQAAEPSRTPDFMAMAKGDKQIAARLTSQWRRAKKKMVKRQGIKQEEGMAPPSFQPGAPKSAAPEFSTAMRRRYQAISEIFDKVTGEAKAGRRVLDRADVEPGEIGSTKKGGEAAFFEVSKQDMESPERLADLMVGPGSGARVREGENVSHTRRLVVIQNRLNGRTHLVSAFNDGRRGFVVNEPIPAGRTKDMHVPIGSLLNRYRVTHGVLLTEPVRDFRQDYKSMADFNARWGERAREIAAEEAQYQEKFEARESYDLAEATGFGTGEGAVGRAERVPMMDAEATALWDQAIGEVGRVESPEDFSLAFEGLKQSPNRTVTSAYMKLARELQRRNPDLDVETLRKKLAQDLFNIHEQSGSMDEMIARTMELGGGKRPTPTPAETPSPTARELYAPRPAATIRTEVSDPRFTRPMAQKALAEIQARAERLAAARLVESGRDAPASQRNAPGERSPWLKMPGAFRNFFRGPFSPKPEEIFPDLTHALPRFSEASDYIFATPFAIEKIPGVGRLWGRRGNMRDEVDVRLVSYAGKGKMGEGVALLAARDVAGTLKGLGNPFEQNADGAFKNVKQADPTQAEVSMYPSDVFEDWQRKIVVPEKMIESGLYKRTEIEEYRAKNPDTYQLTGAQDAAFRKIYEYIEDGYRYLSEKNEALDYYEGVSRETRAAQGSLPGLGKELAVHPLPRVALHKRGASPLERTATFQRVKKATYDVEQERLYATEQEGQQTTVYEPDLSKRVASFAMRVYRAVADADLANDPVLGRLTTEQRIEMLAKRYREDMEKPPGTPGRKTQKDIIEMAQHPFLGIEARSQILEGIYPKAIAGKIDKALKRQEHDVVEYIAAASSAMKALTLTGDAAQYLIQGLPLATTNPRVWARSTLASLKTLSDPLDATYKITPEDLGAALEYVQMGGSLGRLKDFMAGAEPGELAASTPGIRQVVLRSGRAFGVFFDTAKLELWKAERAAYPKSQWPKLVESIETGLLTAPTTAGHVHPARAVAENVALTAASYYRAGVQMLAAAATEKGKIGSRSRRMLGSYIFSQVAFMAGAYLAAGMAADEILERLTPSLENPKFLRFPFTVGGTTLEIGPGGFVMDLMALMVDIGITAKEDVEDIAVGRIGIGEARSIPWGKKNPIVQFLSTKLGPIPRLTSELYTGEDVFGRPITAGRALANSTTPLSGQQFWDAKSKRNIPAALVDAAASLIGLRASGSNPAGDIKRKAIHWLRKSNLDRSGAAELGGDPLYPKFRAALEADNENQAKNVYRRLIRNRNPLMIDEAMENWASSPFTGNLDNEAKFKKSLDESGKKLYDEAVAYRVAIYKKWAAFYQRLKSGKK